MLTDEQKLKNLSIFFKKLNDSGVDTTSLQEKYESQLLNASFALTNETFSAYDGSLLHIVLRMLTPCALQLNNIYHESIKVSTETLVKVCLLHQISKSLMFTPNDNEWEVKNRGMVYKYAPYDFAFKMGMRSLMMCYECNIELTPMEIEALTILDRYDNDEQARFRCNVISMIIRQANEITNLQLRKLANNA